MAARTVEPPPAPALFSPSAWWMNTVVELNRLQWDAFRTWQQSVAAYQKDLWEQWAVRYTGGFPIDG
jgi:hypothetical protein